MIKGSQWLLLGLLMGLLTGTTVACQGGTGEFFSTNEDNDGVRPEPYIRFTQTVNDVGPMVAPILEEIAQTSSGRLSGLGDDDGSSAVQPLPPVNPLEVNMDMAIATDSELLPLNQVLYEQFIQAGYSGIMDIKAMSTDTALQSFCQRDGVDLLTISRAMTLAERSTCQQQGRDVVEFAIGQDALLLVVNPDETFVKGVGLDTLADILTQTNWADVRSGWPDEPIQRKLIGPDSAAVNLLATTLFEQNLDPILNAPNTDFNNYPEPMLQSLSTTDYGVGIVNASAYERSPSVFRAVPIAGITASQETIERGTYPLGKILYLYADRQQLQVRRHNTNLQDASSQANGNVMVQSPSSRSIASWINFYLTHVNEAIPSVYLLPLDQTQLNAAKLQWLEVMGFNPDLTQKLSSPNAPSR
ncbi:MAG: hypothetical protein F6K30_15050 [Cyanothece sp. SIO2G6]|nr:hypothetical protein [Cyanothece sp. SIO2G6]